MAYPNPSRALGFAAKVEATPGTPETLNLAMDAIRLWGIPTVNEAYLAPNERDDLVTGGIGTPAPATPSGRTLEYGIQFVPIGAGAPYSASVLPECDALLRAAGFNRTVTTGSGQEKVTYAPSDDPTATVTAQLQMDNKTHVITYGVAQSLSLSVDAGSFPIFSMALRGIAQTETETALGAHTYDAVEFPIWRGSGSLAISGVTGIVPLSLTLDLGLTVVERASANATDGHAGFKIVRRRPVLTLVCETLPISAWNPSADQAAGTARQIDVTIGSAQYKRLKIDIDAAYVIAVNRDDRDGRRIYEVQFLCSTPATGSECSLIFD